MVKDFLEQRKTARLDVSIQANLKGAVTKNISVGGCLLLTTEDLSLGTILEMEMRLQGETGNLLSIKGEIVRLNRAEKGLYEYGIAFENLSKEKREIFANYFFKKMYEMIGLKEWPTDTRRNLC